MINNSQIKNLINKQTKHQVIHTTNNHKHTITHKLKINNSQAKNLTICIKQFIKLFTEQSQTHINTKLIILKIKTHHTLCKQSHTH